MAGFPLAALAQAANEQGINPYGSYHGGDLDQVSVQNGHLELRIPIKDYPQRGGKLGLTFIVRYHNAVWNERKSCPPISGGCLYFWEWDQAPGAQFVLEQGAPGITSTVLNPQTNCGQIACYLYAYALLMPDGAQHPLGNIGGTQYESLDATGFKWDSSNGTITLADGTRYVTPSSGIPYLEDVNGNQISLGSTVGDSLGRNVPAGPSIATSDFSGCTGLLPIASAALWSVPGSNGATETFKFCFANVHIFTNHHFSGGLPQNQTQIQGNVSMLQSIVLPDETAWTFDYSQPDANGINWGDLVKITYPTGGAISYTWSHGVGCNVLWGPPGSTSGSVLTRAVDANDGSGPQTWHYAAGTVTDPLGNDTVHGFTDINVSCSLYETQTQYYSGSKTGGTLLKTVTRDYSWTPNPNVPYTSSVLPGQLAPYLR
jgi:hypothetical protein